MFTHWDVMPDLFFYRDPEEADKEEKERQEAAQVIELSFDKNKKNDYKYCDGRS